MMADSRREAHEATLKFIMTSGKKDKGQVRLQKSQAELKSGGGGAQIYTYAFFFSVLGLLTTVACCEYLDLGG